MALTTIAPLPKSPLAEEVTTATSVPTPPTILRASASNLDYNAATSSSYLSFFNESLTAQENFHLLAVDLLSPTTFPDPPTSQEYAVLGQRIAVAVTTTDTAASLSTVICNASINHEANSTSVTAENLPPAASATLRSAVAAEISAKASVPLSQGISDCITWLVQHNGQTPPQPLFQIDLPAICEMRSGLYALNHIAKGDRRCDAMTHLNAAVAPNIGTDLHRVSPLYVAAVYAAFNLGDSDYPSANDKTNAAALLGGGGGKGMPSSSAPASYEVATLPFVCGASNVPASLLNTGLPSNRISLNPSPPSPGGPAALTQIVDTLSTWAESLHLGFDILGIKADNTSKFFRYGVTATFTQSGLTGTIILKEIYKVSIDSVIRYNGSDAAINTASLLAANVGLGKAQAVYGVTVVGVDLSQIPSLSSFCGGAFGAFDPSALGRIGTVWSDVNAAITAANPSVVKPVLSSVVLDLTANELQAKAMIAGMVAFALRKITCRMTLDQAVAQSPENYVDVVKRVYADLGVNGAPAAADVAYANSLLQLGK